jgi:hypothetical protein
MTRERDSGVTEEIGMTEEVGAILGNMDFVFIFIFTL